MEDWEGFFRSPEWLILKRRLASDRDELVASLKGLDPIKYATEIARAQGELRRLEDLCDGSLEDEFLGGEQ